MQDKFTNFVLDLLFPKFCLNCKKEGEYLCEDCLATLEISGFHQKYLSSCLADLYFPLNYQKPLVQNIIKLFKYEPFVKDLSKTLSSLIIYHFQLLDNKPNFSDYILVPVPLQKNRLKWRGFNQAEETGKGLTEFFKIPLISDCLIKIKETPKQVELSDEERKKNIKGVFLCQNQEKIKGKRILLIDDVFTTGSTMTECALALKEAGAREITGVVVARG